MTLQTLIYVYIAVCVGMIIFNCVCVFVFRSQKQTMRKRVSQLEDAVMRQIKNIGYGRSVNEAHKELLQKMLVHTSILQAFDETLETLLVTQPENAKIYLNEINPVFTYLAVDNRYHSTIKLTYFAYFIKKYRIIEGRTIPAITDFLMELLHEPSLYSRENALQAIYSSGDSEYVLRALKIITEDGKFHHTKLLTDGLLTFGGDKNELALKLWNSFNDFSVSMKVAILDFFRFGGVDLKDELLVLLADTRTDDEIRLSCIRYFGKYPCDQAYPMLIDFVESAGKRRWEYAAVAATALSSYRRERTVDVLKHALKSSNWYIRLNAAKSLECFSLTYLELSDVMDSNDRYAREILKYQISLKKAAQGQEVTGK